jgi:antitoxin CptB
VETLPELGKLRWHCRRGTRELDVLVTRYLEKYYEDALLEDKWSFIRLLECQDPDLIAWIMGHRNDFPDAGVARIVHVLSNVQSLRD